MTIRSFGNLFTAILLTAAICVLLVFSVSALHTQRMRIGLLQLRSYSWQLTSLNNLASEYMLFREEKAEDRWRSQHILLLETIETANAVYGDLSFGVFQETLNANEKIFNELSETAFGSPACMRAASELSSNFLLLQNSLRGIEEEFIRKARFSMLLSYSFTVVFILILIAVILLVNRTLKIKTLNPILMLTAAVKNNETPRVIQTLPDKVGNEIDDLIANLVELEKSRDENHCRLVKLNSDLEQVAYIASHDLREPIRGIQELVNSLYADTAGLMHDEARENLELIQSRVGRMEKLLSDLLNRSRAGSNMEAVELLDCMELVESVVGFLECGDRVTINSYIQSCVIETERIPFEMVIRSLLSDKIKNTAAADKDIMINLFDSGDYIRIEISENRTEPADHFNSLKTADRAEESWIGPEMVKKIVENAGGTVSLSSDNGEANGAMFVIEWPKKPVETESGCAPD